MSFADKRSAEYHHHRGDEEACVAFLSEVAGSGPVLELAIGTGRIALPLAAAGHEVEGIDFAPEMIAHLRKQPSGETLSVKLDNFVDVAMDREYSLIYIVWNSFFNVLSQDEQLRCFANVAERLTPSGRFLIEAYVPSYLHRLQDDQQVLAESVAAREVRIGVMTHDAATQTIEQSHVSLSPDGIRLNPVAQRYCWPSELDLMAKLAGLTLEDRFGGWARQSFESQSALHISLYKHANA